MSVFREVDWCSTDVKLRTQSELGFDGEETPEDEDAYYRQLIENEKIFDELKRWNDLLKPYEKYMRGPTP